MHPFFFDSSFLITGISSCSSDCTTLISLPIVLLPMLVKTMQIAKCRNKVVNIFAYRCPIPTLSSLAMVVSYSCRGRSLLHIVKSTLNPMRNGHFKVRLVTVRHSPLQGRFKCALSKSCQHRSLRTIFGEATGLKLLQ